MSPKNKKKLYILRVKLDKLDNKLIDLIKIRTNLVNEVVKLKEYKNEIVDKKRISVILKKIKKKSINSGVDPKITQKIWKSIIWSYVYYQTRNLERKKEFLETDENYKEALDHLKADGKKIDLSLRPEKLSENSTISFTVFSGSEAIPKSETITNAKVFDSCSKVPGFRAFITLNFSFP